MQSILNTFYLLSTLQVSLKKLSALSDNFGFACLVCNKRSPGAICGLQTFLG